MNKRQRKKKFKQKYGVSSEVLAEKLLRAFGQALGEARADYMEKLMKDPCLQPIVSFEEWRKAHKKEGQD